MNLSLFEQAAEQPLGEGAILLRGFALSYEAALWLDLQTVLARAPFRHMVTAGGFRMSVAMTNCGALGWVSDETGYRYDAIDPESGRRWPELPPSFSALAGDAARKAGYAGFDSDACLINRYDPGARLSLHQDRNEKDFEHPIVSVSLGLPATFLFGGMHRSSKTESLELVHGDIVVWGGPSRLRYHGVRPLREGSHPLTGACRINLTFRKAG